MLLGTTIFFCDNCNKKFKGLNMEFQCTCLTSPQRCPYCGSYHTLPDGSQRFYQSLYEKIWQRMDETKEYHSTCFINPEIYDKAITECEEWNQKTDEEKNNETDDEAQANAPTSTWSKIVENTEVAIVIMVVLFIGSLTTLGDMIKRIFKRE